MADVTIVGGGPVASACRGLLARAGFDLRSCFDIAASTDRSPIILGETAQPLEAARYAVESGRHLLIGNPLVLGPERLGQLLAARRRGQAVFIWSERRYHPSYHFAHALAESDATWKPRFLRHESLLSEPPSPGRVRWRLAEAIGLLLSLSGDRAREVAASAAEDERRTSPDFLHLTLNLQRCTAYIEMGLGEPVERRETLIASQDRKALIDEMNPAIPLRLIEGQKSGTPSQDVRWLSCSAPALEELVRLQCLAFLEATSKNSLASQEAELWQSSFQTLSAAEASIGHGGLTVRVGGFQTDPAAEERRTFVAAPPALV